MMRRDSSGNTSRETDPSARPDDPAAGEACGAEPRGWTLGAEDLADFCEFLRSRGFKIATLGCVWAHQVLLRIAAQGRLPEDPRALAFHLGPIFCGNAQEQQRFPEIFASWLDLRWPTETKKDDPPPPEKKDKERTKNRRMMALGAAFLAVAILVLVFVVPEQSRKWPPAGVPRPPRPDDPKPPPAADTGAIRTVQLSDVVKLTEPREEVWPFVVGYLPILLFVAWWMWNRWRFRPVLERLMSETPRNLREVRLAGGTRSLLPGLPVRQLARELRRRRTVQSRELDTEATIAATLRGGGLFTPVFGSRVEPDYLVLIDRASLADHQAKLAETLVQALAMSDVSIECFYYDGNPLICRSAETPGRGMRFSTVGLDELSTRFPEHRVMLFSDGRGFFDGFTGEPARWLPGLESWIEKVVVTPEPSDRWGRREWAIEKLGFTLLPLSRRGIAELGEVFRERPITSHSPPSAREVAQPLFARTPSRWLERHPPLPEVVDRLCAELEDHLGQDGFAWLAACAVYPEVHWGLTLRLGRSLIPVEQEFEKMLPRLTRLVWLREGYLPDWLREALIARLPPQQVEEVRRLIEKMFAVALKFPEGDLALQISPDGSSAGGVLGRILRRSLDWLLSRSRRRYFLRKVLTAPPESLLKDHVFLRFVSGSAGPLRVSAPPQLLRLLFPRGVRLFGIRPSIAFLIALGCSVILFTILLPDSGSISPLSLAFGPEGNLLVAGGRMGEVLLWDARKSEPLGAKSSIFRRSRISHIEFSPDRKVLAIGSNGSVVLWNRETLKSLGLEPPIGLFTGFCFTPDGKNIAQAGSTGLVVLNDVASGSVDSVLSKYERTASALAFSPNERLLAIGNADGTIGFLEIGEGSQSRFTPSGHRGAVNAVRFHPDGRSLASAGEDGMVALWDLSKPKGEGLQTVQQIGSLRLPSEPVSAATALAFSSDGKTLAVANRKGQIFNWSLSSGARAYAFLAGEEPSLYRVLAQEFAFESMDFSTIRKLKSPGSDATWLFYVPGETAEHIAEFLSQDPSDASIPGFDLAQVLSSVPFGQVLVIVDAPVEERDLAAARNLLRRNRRGGICTCLSAPLEDLVAANAPNGLSFMDAVVQALEVSPGLTSGRELAEEVAGILGRRPTYSSLTDAGPPGRDFYFPAKVYAPLASEGGQKDQNASSERSKRERPRTSGAQKPPEGK
jgi:hypothetical protein